jgi:hypothetical protein
MKERNSLHPMKTLRHIIANVILTSQSAGAGGLRAIGANLFTDGRIIARTLLRILKR